LGASLSILIPPDSAINATLYDKLNFNFVRDIAPIAGVFRGAYVLVVNLRPHKAPLRESFLCKI
jgi:hypothetical protein